MTTQQPEALDLANWLDAVGNGGISSTAAAVELRRQHTRIADLEAQLEAIGAGGVSGPLMGCAALTAAQPAAPQQEAQEPVAWNSLTDEDRERAMNSMPGMLEGFLKTWGWLHFAKAIEAICREKNAQPSPAAQGDALDAARLDWLDLAGPVSICLVMDREHDGEVEVSTDDVTGYGKTVRAAIDAARATQEGKSHG